MAIISTVRRSGSSAEQRRASARRGGLSLPSTICTLALLLFSVGQAQYFADFKYQANGDSQGQRSRGDINADSAMSKLDGTSSVWDYMSAASSDYLNQGAFEAMRR